jgi:protein required for attachment to host cells
MNASTWVVVGDAHGARVLSFVKRIDPWKVVEHIKEDGSGAAETADFGHRASEHKGALRSHAGSTPKDHEEQHLARAIAHALERGMVDGAFGSLVIVAAPKLLGDLRENLSRGLQAMVVAEVNKDYTGLSVDELATTLRPQLPV